MVEKNNVRKNEQETSIKPLPVESLSFYRDLYAKARIEVIAYGSTYSVAHIIEVLDIQGYAHIACYSLLGIKIPLPVFVKVIS